MSEGGPLAGIKVDAAAPRPTALDSDDPRPGAASVIDDDARRSASAAFPTSRRSSRSSRHRWRFFRRPVRAPRRTGRRRRPDLHLGGRRRPRACRRPAGDPARRSLPRSQLDDRGRGHARLSQSHRRRQGERADASSARELTLGAPQEFASAASAASGRGGPRQIVGVVSQEAGDGYLVAPTVGRPRRRALDARGRRSTGDLGINPSPYSALFVVARGSRTRHRRAHRDQCRRLFDERARDAHHAGAAISPRRRARARPASASSPSPSPHSASPTRCWPRSANVDAEIGVLKAIGATDRDVRRVFLVEAGALGLLGGVIGAAAGLLTAEVLAGRRESVPLEPGPPGRRPRLPARRYSRSSWPAQRSSLSRPASSPRRAPLACRPVKRSATSDAAHQRCPRRSASCSRWPACSATHRSAPPLSTAAEREPTTFLTIGEQRDRRRRRPRSPPRRVAVPRVQPGLPDLGRPRERRGRRRHRRQRASRTGAGRPRASSPTSSRSGSAPTT